MKCNAGQPQVPGRGRKVSRVGKLYSTRGPLIKFLFAGFKLKAPPSLSSSFFFKEKKTKKISIPKADQFTKLFFFFNAENSWKNGRRLTFVFQNECCFSSFEINDMHVQTIFL